MKKKVVSATVTPLMEDGSLDRQGLRNLIDRGAKHKLDGMFLYGSMGEWGGLSADVKLAGVELASSYVKDRFELLVGINATSLPLSLALMEEYRKYDFSAYVFMLPGNTSRLDPIKSVLTVLDKADRPVYFYYCPGNNNIVFKPRDFETLMRHPNLKGIKNSSSNMYLRRELLLLRAEKGLKTLFFEGQEWATDEALTVGYDGMICGMGAVCSKMMRKLADCVDAGDIAGAVATQNRMIQVFHGVYGPNVENCWTGQKYALVKLGVIATPYTFAQEMSVLDDAAKARIEKCLEEFKADID